MYTLYQLINIGDYPLRCGPEYFICLFYIYNKIPRNKFFDLFLCMGVKIVFSD